MKLIKTASGKITVKMNKAEWEAIGKQAGWDLGKKVREGLDWAKDKLTGQPQQPAEQTPTVPSVPKTLDNDEVSKMFAFIKGKLPYSNNNMANPQNMTKIKQHIQKYMRIKGIKGTVEEALASLQKTNMWGTDAASPSSKREIRQSDEMHGKFQKMSTEEFNKIFKI